MAHEPQRRRPLAEPTVAAPDISFKAGFGFYLGLVLAGLSALVGLLVGASTEAVVATAPGTVTGVLLCTLIVGDRLRGLPEWLGRSRRRRLTCYTPVLAFGGVAAVPAVTALEYTAAFGSLAVAFVFLTAVMAAGVARMSRNRYVDAVTGDDPIVSWSWRRTGFGFGGHGWVVLGIGMAVFGLLSVWLWGWTSAIVLTVYGIVFLFGAWTDAFDGGDAADTEWGLATFRAYETGLVLERAAGKRLVPWDAIEAVRLTDDGLVLERRWRDIRCDRAVIDDPETVYEEIERTRERTTLRSA